MRVIVLMLLLGGCASDRGDQPSSVNMRMNGVYTTFGGGVVR